MFEDPSFKEQIRQETSAFYQWQSFKSRYPELISYLTMKYPDVKGPEALYIWLYGKPSCMTCGSSNLTFINFRKGYREFCCRACSNKNELVRVKKSKKIKNLNHASIAEKKRKTYFSKSVEELEKIKERRKAAHKKRDKEKEQKRREKISNWWKCNDLTQIKIKRQISRRRFYYRQLLERVNGIVKPLFIEEEFVGVDHRIKYEWECCECNNVFQDDCDDGKLPRCPTCKPINTYSYKEKELFDFVSNVLPGYEIISRTREVIPPKELDIYIPAKKIAIEFCGVYWHSDVFMDKHYHYDKFKMCQEQGIHLITIFEDQWDSKKQIVQNRLRSILGVDERVYARKCTVMEVSSKIARQFMEKTHIQGFCSSSIYLGLFHDNCLVALMSFGKARYSDAEYELLRYSTVNTVVGGASKLFKYFIRKYKPKMVVSYADRCWSQGNLYRKLGFEDVTRRDRNVGYYYVAQTGVRYHRSNFMSNEKKRTEKFFKIWTCGNYKFLWLPES